MCEINEIAGQSENCKNSCNSFAYKLLQSKATCHNENKIIASSSSRLTGNYIDWSNWLKSFDDWTNCLQFTGIGRKLLGGTGQHSQQENRFSEVVNQFRIVEDKIHYWWDLLSYIFL